MTSQFHFPQWTLMVKLSDSGGIVRKYGSCYGIEVGTEKLRDILQGLGLGQAAATEHWL